MVSDKATTYPGLVQYKPSLRGNFEQGHLTRQAYQLERIPKAVNNASKRITSLKEPLNKPHEPTGVHPKDVTHKPDQRSSPVPIDSSIQSNSPTLILQARNGGHRVIK